MATGTYYSSLVRPATGLAPGGSTANPTLKQSADGDTVTVVAEYTATAILSATAVVQMVPIPEGATITDITVSALNDTGTGAISVGDGDSAGRFGTGIVSSVTTPTITRVTKGLPYKYTFADGVVNKWDTIDITVTTAGTGAAVGNVYKMVVSYTTAN